MSVDTWQAFDISLDSSNGIGRYYSGTIGNAGFRGGSRQDDASIGIYTLRLYRDADYEGSSVGFRCVYRP